MKIFGIEYKFNDFDIWHTGNLTKLSDLTNDIGAGGGIKITTSSIAPSNPSPGDFWYKV